MNWHIHSVRCVNGSTYRNDVFRLNPTSDYNPLTGCLTGQQERVDIILFKHSVCVVFGNIGLFHAKTKLNLGLGRGVWIPGWLFSFPEQRKQHVFILLEIASQCLPSLPLGRAGGPTFIIPVSVQLTTAWWEPSGQTCIQITDPSLLRSCSCLPSLVADRDYKTLSLTAMDETLLSYVQ